MKAFNRDCEIFANLRIAFVASSGASTHSMFTLQLMKIGKKVLGKTLFAALMKPTFYGQFVAGEVSHSTVCTVSV